MPSLESELTKMNEWEPSKRADALLQASGARIEHRGGNRAFYRRSEDLIVLPKQDQFRSPEAYYSTALHELGHWTGHESRLDRSELMKGNFGSPEYAKEELRAEMTSLTVNGMLGLPHDPNSHASYVASWIKVLEDNPNELRHAARDAGKMSDYILQFDRYEERQAETKPREAGNSSSFSG
ncbi:MAG: zincin-like metallopeptidase domain-containing protein [Bryobacterales bacterium]|nr:zincin-like metallopeptidase domain-containing protein [Bryobacterales bacterium]